MEERTIRSKRRRRKKNNILYILEIILCLIAVTGIGIALLFLTKYHSVKLENEELGQKLSKYEDAQNPYYSALEVEKLTSDKYEEGVQAGLEQAENQKMDDDDLLAQVKKTLMETDSAYETFQLMFPDDLIVIDEGEYLFFPISDELKHHNYLSEDFAKLNNNRIVYSGDSCKTEIGIDVSKFQEKINWGKVASDGIDFAIIRMAYRGYSKGEIMEDDYFEDNIKGALANDIKVGVYFLTQATTDAEAREEAQYVLDGLEPYDVAEPVVLDVEMVGGKEGRGNSLAMEDRTRYAKIFLDTVSKAGYDVCIYGNLKTFLLLLNMEELEQYPKWFAGYTDTPYFPYEMDFWQYTDTGRVNGVTGDVDINIHFIK